MAIPFLQHIDLNKNELQNAVVQSLGTAPGSPTEGQIYFDATVGDKSIYFYNGSAWVSVGGDITGVTVNAGEGLEVEAGSASTTSGAFSVTLVLQAAVAGNGLSYSSGVLAVGVDDTTIELNSDAIRVKDNSITIAKLEHRTASHVLKMDGSGVPTSGTIATANIADDAVTGAKIAADTIDSEHYKDGSIDNEHIADNAIDSEHYATGSVDNVHLANDGITIGTADTSLGGTVTALVGLTDLDLTSGNKTIFDTVGANVLTMGAAGTTITIPGNLIVAGTQTISDSTVKVVEDNTLQFEGAAGTDAAHELNLTTAVLSADRTITLPNLGGHVALFAVAPTATITSTPAELNLLDGVSGLVQADFTKLAAVDASAAELNVLDGYTGSVTELNYLDTLHATGVTSTEYDYLDGVTSNIQTQLDATEDASNKITKKLSGDGSATTYSISHGFATPIVQVQVLHYGDNGTGATYDVVQVEIERDTDSAVDIIFGTAPTTAEDYLVLISKFPAITP